MSHFRALRVFLTAKRLGTFTPYGYEPTGGEGVGMHAVDTGINIHRVEFGGRAYRARPSLRAMLMRTEAAMEPPRWYNRLAQVWCCQGQQPHRRQGLGFQRKRYNG